MHLQLTLSLVAGRTLRKTEMTSGSMEEVHRCNQQIPHDNLLPARPLRDCLANSRTASKPLAQATRTPPSPVAFSLHILPEGHQCHVVLPSERLMSTFCFVLGERQRCQVHENSLSSTSRIPMMDDATPSEFWCSPGLAGCWDRDTRSDPWESSWGRPSP